MPRRARPVPPCRPGRSRWPTGHAAVYPSASPGGWQLIGRTDVPLFTPWTPPYARLAPGDRVRFVKAGHGHGTRHRTTDIGARLRCPAPKRHPSGARPVFVVEEPGLRTVLQDGGRQGLAALGVPAAGPADPVSFRLANRAGGQPGRRLRPRDHGARPDPALPEPDASWRSSAARPICAWTGQPLGAGPGGAGQAGQRLVVGPVRGGFRCYVAVGRRLRRSRPCSGATPAISWPASGPGRSCGARSCGAPPWSRPWATICAWDAPGGVRPTGEPVALRVVPGPHPERFAPGTFATLASRAFTVEADEQPGGPPAPARPAAPPARVAPAPRRARLPGHGDRRRAGPARRRAGHPADRPRHPRRLPGRGRRRRGRPRRAGPVRARNDGRARAVGHDEAAAALREHTRALDLAVVGHYPLAVE